MIFQVENVIYHNDSNGYTVLRCGIYENGKRVDTGVGVTGYMLPQSSGMRFEAQAEMKNTQYGEQYEVTSFEELEPVSEEGIVNLIVSLKLKGIGKKKAQKIYNAFGKNTISVLDSDFYKLKEIKNTSWKDIEIAKKQWEESRDVREMLKLVGSTSSIGHNKILKIRNYFKEDCVSVIKNEPYRLTEVEGIGFDAADAVARKVLNPFLPDSALRIQAGCMSILFKAMDEGHLFLTTDCLLETAYNFLNINVPYTVSKETIKFACNDMYSSGKIAFTSLGNNVSAIYPNSNYKYETETAKLITEFAFEKTKEVDEEKVNAIIDRLQKDEGIMLADRQKDGILSVFKYNVVCITGGPGNGKTTTINMLLQTYEELFPNDEIALMAPTGRAARRMRETTGRDAFTIHSKLNLRDDEDMGETIAPDLVVIDEMSMVDQKLMYRFMTLLEKKCKIVLVGDVDQLPSVGAGNVFAEIINSGVIKTTVLDVPFRQDKQNLIYKNSRLINKGITDLEFGNEFQYISATTEEEIERKCCEIYQKEVANYGGNSDNIYFLTPYRKRTKIGSNQMNLTLRQMINPETDKSIVTGPLNLKKGDKVMQLKNINEDGMLLSNGDIGYVTGFSKNEYDNNVITVTYDGVGERDYSKSSDFEMLDLAYASTVHKSQGGEADVVIMPMSFMFSRLLKRNIIYTSVTRSKVRFYLVGDIRAFNKAINDNTYARRNTLLACRIKLEAKKYQEMAKKEEKKKEEYTQLSFVV